MNRKTDPTPPQTLPCPICKAAVTIDGPERSLQFPFCSDRCKLVDLGRWLGGKYQIPVEEPDESDAASRD